jgi:hypothetical protein
MTCAEFQSELPDFLDEGDNLELQAHLKSCANCSGLAASLQSIAREARKLQASQEPSPRVWNSLEIALRREGLIHEPRPHGHRLVLPSLTRRWGMAAWLVPVAAALLVAAAILLYQRPNTKQVALNTQSPVMTVSGDLNDEQLLQEVSTRAPLMRATYESNLRDVNAYIRDAQASVNADPNDEEAQQALMDAYGQRSMIYEMALDRSLP